MTASFTELGLSQELLKAVEDLGFEEPSPIQVLAIPALLTGKDAVGQAQTGTGILSRQQCRDSQNLNGGGFFKP